MILGFSMKEREQIAILDRLDEYSERSACAELVIKNAKGPSI
jgi:hypothetical protein